MTCAFHLQVFLARLFEVVLRTVNVCGIYSIRETTARFEWCTKQATDWKTNAFSCRDSGRCLFTDKPDLHAAEALPQLRWLSDHKEIWRLMLDCYTRWVL